MFLWPGFGQNIRVLRWMLERIDGTAAATTTAIGYVPTPDSLDLAGLNLSPETVNALLQIDHTEWQGEASDIASFFASFGEDLPVALRQELQQLQQRLA